MYRKTAEAKECTLDASSKLTFFEHSCYIFGEQKNSFFIGVSKFVDKIIVK